MRRSCIREANRRPKRAWQHVYGAGQKAYSASQFGRPFSARPVILAVEDSASGKLKGLARLRPSSTRLKICMSDLRLVATVLLQAMLQNQVLGYSNASSVLAAMSSMSCKGP